MLTLKYLRFILKDALRKATKIKVSSKFFDNNACTALEIKFEFASYIL